MIKLIYLYQTDYSSTTCFSIPSTSTSSTCSFAIPSTCCSICCSSACMFNLLIISEIIIKLIYLHHIDYSSSTCFPISSTFTNTSTSTTCSFAISSTCCSISCSSSCMFCIFIDSINLVLTYYFRLVLHLHHLLLHLLQLNLFLCHFIKLLLNMMLFLMYVFFILINSVITLVLTYHFRLVLHLHLLFLHPLYLNLFLGQNNLLLHMLLFLLYSL